MTVSRRQLLLTGPASALLTADVLAQPPAAQPGGPGKEPALDTLLAALLLIAGRKQIENCTYAFKKLLTAEGKALATAEIEEHEAMKKSLKALGFEYPVAPVPGNRPGQISAWAVTSGPEKLPAGAAALIALEHEVAEQCIANFLVQMGAYVDREFEKRFVGHQLDEHLSLLDKVQTFRRHASLKLEGVLADGQKVVVAHIATLKKLMTDFDKSE